MKPRIPPHSIDAERQVLGSIIIDSRQEAVATAVEILTAGEFYWSSHQKIFTVMLALYERSIAIDVISVSEELRRCTWLQDAGGDAYLTELSRDVVAGLDIEYYAKLVHEKSILRQLIIISQDVNDRSFRDTEIVGDLIDDLESRIFELSKDTSRREFVSTHDLADPVMEKITELYNSDTDIVGIPTGYRQFDRMTNGLHPGNLIVIAARPSMGKTALGLNIAHNAAREGNGVGIFSMEMTSQDLFRRLLCAEARVDSERVSSGKLLKPDWPLLTQASNTLMNYPIYIDESSTLSVMEVRAKARRLIGQDPRVGLIIVDYLQLMRGHSRTENRQQEVSEISRMLKALAMEEEIPVIAISQLSRAVESRTDRTPQLSDLRESGAIEQDADLVVFIHRPNFSNKFGAEEERNPEEDTEAKIIIAKQRNGPVGVVDLRFIDRYMRFENPYHGDDVPDPSTIRDTGVLADSAADFV